MTTLNNVRVGVIETQRLWVVFVCVWVWCCLSGSTDFNTTGASWSLIPWSIRPLQPGGTWHVLIRPAASSVTFTYIKGCENNGHRGSVLYLTQPVKDVSKWYSYMSQTNFTWSISLQLELLVLFLPWWKMSRIPHLLWQESACFQTLKPLEIWWDQGQSLQRLEKKKGAFNKVLNFLRWFFSFIPSSLREAWDAEGGFH